MKKRTRKRKATTAELIDWRLGHHIEAAAKLVSDAFNRIADQLARANDLQATEIDIRREHLLSVLESKAMADRAAQRLMGMIPDGAAFVDLRRSGKPSEDGETRGPEWVKDVLADADAHTDKH